MSLSGKYAAVGLLSVIAGFRRITYLIERYTQVETYSIERTKLIQSLFTYFSKATTPNCTTS